MPVSTGRKVKVFSDKLGETVEQPSCTKYNFGLKGILFRIPCQSKYLRQVPMSREKSLLVDTELVSWFKSGQIFELHLFGRKERFKQRGQSSF